MHAELTSPITGNVLTIDTRETGTGAAATLDGASNTVPAHVEQTFTSIEAADVWAATLRDSLIAGGLQDTTADGH